MIWILFVVFIVQSACSTTKAVLPTSTVTEGTLPTSTKPPTETTMPTEAMAPTQTTNSTPIVNGEWADAPAMPTPRSAHAMVNSDSTIYVLAGTDDQGRPVLDVDAFDGSQWNVETTLPGQGLNAPTASIIDTKLFVMGGFTAVTNKPTDEVQVYDLQSHQWSMASPLPSPRGGHAAVILDGKVHLLGGGNSVSTIADHSQYDPATDTWAELAPLPRAEGSPAAVTVDGRIYVIGGRSGNSDFGDVYIYDPETDAWSMAPSIEPRGTASAVVYWGGIYLVGGESQAEHKNLESVLRFDLERNVWETVSPMPTARKFARAAVFMNSIYVVGGSTVMANSHSPIGTSSVVQFTQSGCS
jgi:N-acetylneuraminic acid mutarotase